MRYSVLGFNQALVLEKYKDLNLTDLMLLDYIWQAQAQPSMQHTIDNGHVFVWLNHTKILEDLPILDIKENMLKKKIKHLINIGLLQSKIIASDKTRGSKAYYGITNECEELRFTEDNTTTCKKLHENNSSRVKNYTCSDGPRVKNYTSDNKLIDDNKLEKEDISKDISKKKPTFSLNHSVAQRDNKTVNTIIDMYLTICTNLPKIRAVTDKRRKAVQTLIKNHSIEQFKEVFEIANTSAFLLGDNDRGWKADFDFLMEEDKFVKTLEGKYSGSNKKKINKFGETTQERCGREREVKELHVIAEY